jgi:hypothetical protein
MMGFVNKPRAANPTIITKPKAKRFPVELIVLTLLFHAL